MPRYLQTEVHFIKASDRKQELMGIKQGVQEKKWASAIINLDAIVTANPSWIFDEYDLDSPGCPERNCTEILLSTGQDLSINIPFTEFVEYLKV
jgi:hypothetical protein